MTVAQAAGARGTFRQAAADYVSLTKPGIVSLLVATAQERFVKHLQPHGSKAEEGVSPRPDGSYARNRSP